MPVGSQPYKLYDGIKDIVSAVYVFKVRAWYYGSRQNLEDYPLKYVWECRSGKSSLV
jgi:hypothetical protein